jgi:hypothetical protein
LHQVRALLSGTLIFRLIEWVAAAGLVSLGAQLQLEYIFVPLWLSFQIYEVGRIHRIIKLQAASFSPKWFHIGVSRLWNQLPWQAPLVLPALAFLILLNNFPSPYSLFCIALTLHGLFVICWREWLKRRMATASR